MFDRVEKQHKKLIKKAIPITFEQYLKLNKVLEEIKLPYTTFFDCEDKIFYLSNDVFVVKDYFKDLKLPYELVENID